MAQGEATVTTGSGEVTATTAVRAESLQTTWDNSTDTEKNTFAGANTFEINKHIYDSADAQTVLARFPNALTVDEEGIISKFVTQLGSTQWALIIEQNIYGLQDEDNALTGWKSITQIAVNAPPHTSGIGFGHNGTTQYLNSLLTPGGTFLQDDALFGGYVDTSGIDTSPRTPYGAQSATAANAADVFYRTTNSQSQLNGTANTISNLSGDALILFQRQAAASYDYIVDGFIDTSISKASSGIPDVPFFIGARNNNTTPDRFWAGGIQSWIVAPGIGFNYGLYASLYETMRTELAAI